MNSTMNSTLVCLLVFALGSLAAKIPTDVDKNEAPDTNPELLTKKSSELLNAVQDPSLITNRTFEKQNSDRWRKMNFSPVCFGAKNQQFGRFFVNSVSGEKLASVKLVHLYGYLTCDTRIICYWSYWGCRGILFYSVENINIVITTASNQALLPPDQFIVDHGTKWSCLPGYTSVSPELVLSFFNPYSVSSGQELRLWYGEDLMNTLAEDNGGRACVDVYARYV